MKYFLVFIICEKIIPMIESMNTQPTHNKTFTTPSDLSQLTLVNANSQGKCLL